MELTEQEIKDLIKAKKALERENKKLKDEIATAERGSLENLHKDYVNKLKIDTFIAEYIATNDKTQAAINAKMFDKNLDRPQVQNKINAFLKAHPEVETAMYAEVERLAQEKFDKSIMSRDETLQMLTRIARNEETEEMVLTVGEGKGYQRVEKVEKDINAMTRVKATELLGKFHGCFTDRVQLEGALPVVIKDDMDE